MPKYKAVNVDTLTFSCALRRALSIVSNYIFVPFVVGLLTILFAAYLANFVLRKDTGTPAMQKVADSIFAGAMAFLNRQYRTIAILAVFAAIIVGVVLALLGQGDQAAKFSLAWHTSIAFLVGALCSGVSGFIGMYVAVKSNVRTASAATRSLGEALMVSLRGGAVSGFLVVALSLLGVTLVFWSYGGLTNPSVAPSLIVGFGFGASFVALFAQLGGGIYTKAADVGADLVGKIEAGIPEDDPRNAATIADNVGDNVGDCAGMAADIFESYEVTIVAAMILGYASFGHKGVIFPLLVRAIGVIASIVSTYLVRAGDKGTVKEAMASINAGFRVGSVLSIVGYIIQGIAVGYESTVWAVIIIAAAIMGSVLVYGSTGNPVFIAFGVAMCGIGMLTLTGNTISMDVFGPVADNANGIGEMGYNKDTNNRELQPGDVGYMAPEDYKRARQILADPDAVGNTT